jgi:ribosomal protein S18 acetylase RimI-like enzyme
MMPEEINIRSIALADIETLSAMDHSYHTDYVWQMDLQSQPNEVAIIFRQVRLPRSMMVDYPHPPQLMLEEWKQRDKVFVAEIDGETVGYISIERCQMPGLVMVTDLVVLRRLRRHGIGSALLLAGQAWAVEQGNTQILMEMQSKNYPAICLANKLGFEFCGYSDRYYANQDIALFFGRKI